MKVNEQKTNTLISYKNRLKKLFNALAQGINDCGINKLTDNEIDMDFHYDNSGNSVQVDINISIDPETEAWEVQHKRYESWYDDFRRENNTINNDEKTYTGTGYEALVNVFFDSGLLPEEQYNNLLAETLKVSKTFAEDFKVYEDLWDGVLTEEADPVDQELEKLDDYELEYEGFEDDEVTDGFDPNSWYGHTQKVKTYYFDDFTYKVEAKDLFEYLMDFLQDKIEESSTSAIMNEYKKLAQAWWDAEGEEERRACAVVELYVAQNLFELADLYYNDIQEHYSEEAYEWALEHLNPRDEWDEY